MFTGIIETLQPIVKSERSEGQPTTLTVSRPESFNDLGLGDSVAIDGVCLTVTHLEEGSFQVQVAKETLYRTNLGAKNAGDRVGLERSVMPTTRMGGHFVQGHIDCTADVVKADVDDTSSRWLTFKPSNPSLMKYVVTKGYIAISGASITVVDTTEDSFRVMLIPYTQALVSFGYAETGHTVNLEVDVLAKYVEKLHAPK